MHSVLCFLKRSSLNLSDNMCTFDLFLASNIAFEVSSKRYSQNLRVTIRYPINDFYTIIMRCIIYGHTTFHLEIKCPHLVQQTFLSVSLSINYTWNLSGFHAHEATLDAQKDFC